MRGKHACQQAGRPGEVAEIDPADALERLMDHIEALASGGTVEL